MAYVISDTCLGCGACLPQCPVEAISEGTPYTIDAGKCTDCGLCASCCPVEAISQG
ncbi:MAG: 4Fe-4S binding protein [Candidatus Omnitrophica bacterium]|nr:4Fe-4S binding protein [Candidatus Omnitrophota bacterium]